MAQQNPSVASSSSKKIVICGAGIMGAATAYYLSRLGVAATVVERESVACAASGKAGGFLGLDWNDTTAVGPLSRLSYSLHKELAAEFGADTIGYREVHTLSVTAFDDAADAAKHRKRLAGPLPAWLDGHVVQSSVMGSPDTTAQVHPQKLTQALLDAAVQQGANVVKGAVQGVQLSADKEVQGVVVDGGVLAADAVVIAMGPWSQAATGWLPLPPITGQKYHSVVLRPKQPLSNHMLFTVFKDDEGKKVEPEVYPRPDGSVYACGEQEDVGVPESAGHVTVRQDLCERVRKVAASLSSTLAQADVETRQACYLPISHDGLPVIGAIPGVSGAYAATGHSCWGILNGPATGLLVAELLVHGEARSLDLAPFSPSRYFAKRRR